MRVPSALFALLPLLGHLTQAHHDAGLRNHQPRSFKLDVRTPQLRKFFSVDGNVNAKLVKRAIKQHHQRRQAQAVAATRDQTAHLNLLKRAQEMEDMFHAKKARVVGRALKSGSAPVFPQEDGAWNVSVGLGPGGSQKISNLVLDTDGPKYVPRLCLSDSANEPLKADLRFCIESMHQRLSIYAKGSPTKCNSTYDSTKSPHAIKGASYTSEDGISKGDYYQDSVTFGGLEVANQSFVSFTTTTNGENLEDRMDLQIGACGFLGLGINSNPPTLVQTLISSNAIAQPLFAVSLTDTGGTVDIGAIDHSAYKGQIAWAPLLEGVNSTSWMIKTTAFTINGQPVAHEDNKIVYFQTWSPLTVIPSWLGAAIGAFVDKEKTPFYQIGCKEMEKITFGFNIGGQTMEMPLSLFNIAYYPSEPRKCILAIIPAEYSFAEIILGSLAMRTFYVAHSFAHGKIGPAIGVAKAKIDPLLLQ
ncbi:BQ5605_C013g07274 [Microbotryum silenes-dioicae]|uniref:BQ5605_C013g07270 protein n=1 Tax=Microbotryum silenes-dioicae TaxID=796604 RepID=A0A2X0MCP3_9BASI|nr:BQ5605_C013g07270 [Microbotryum silenes-dioicae]SGY15159.1 BQ5605_C013g07272 [Microbotryum silenes-dioicae]SGY15164.1 BQ5605_C013g07274 [Microbotryum silenes-dioicae]